MYIDTLGTAYPTESSTAVSDNELGKDTFLSLLVAQLENQDPLNPMEGTEFTAQLAQYSSLEQLYNVNDNLESIYVEQVESFDFKALDFVGKEILAIGDQLAFEQGESASGAFSIDEAADCSVKITDEEGKLVKTILIGSLDSGTHSFEWDGLDEEGIQLKSGVYNFEVSALGEGDQLVSCDTYISGKVTSLNLEEETPILYIKDLPVNFLEIVDIHISTKT